VAPVGKALAEAVDARGNDRCRSGLAYVDQLAADLFRQPADNGPTGKAILDHASGSAPELGAGDRRTDEHCETQFLEPSQYIAGCDGAGYA
jgi:hypothetical protein